MKKIVVGIVGLSLLSLGLVGCSSSENTPATPPVTKPAESTINPTIEAPNEVERYGRIIKMHKVVAEMGDRKTEVARILGEMREICDTAGKPTDSLLKKADELEKVIPEANRDENQRILLQGNTLEKGFPDPAPTFPFNNESKKKYQEIKDLDIIPFIAYMQELGANVNMYASDLSSEQRRENMKKVRETFDMYARYLASR